MFFEAVKSPIRLVQRMGRTGRQRSGRVVVLVDENRSAGVGGGNFGENNCKEQDKIDAAAASAASIYKSLRQGASSLRLLPVTLPAIVSTVDGSLPVMRLQNLDISEFRLSQYGGASRKTASKKNVCDYLIIFSMLKFVFHFQKCIAINNILSLNIDSRNECAVKGTSMKDFFVTKPKGDRLLLFSFTS